MFEYFIIFIGQFNSSTVYAGERAADPAYVGQANEYYYNTTDNVWKVGGSSSWREIADPSTLIGATIITSTSEVEGLFVDSNNGSNYIIFSGQGPTKRWFQFYSRTATVPPESGGFWRDNTFVNITASAGTVFSSPQNFIGTSSSGQGTISSSGWISLQATFSASALTIPDGFTIRGTPSFYFVYGVRESDGFYFIFKGGSRTVEPQPTHLTEANIRFLFGRGLLIRVPASFIFFGPPDSGTVTFRFNPPSDAEFFYPVGLDLRGLLYTNSPGGLGGFAVSARIGAAAFGTTDMVWGGGAYIDSTVDPTDPVDPRDPAIRCLDPDYYIEAYELCSQLVPPPLCLDRGLFPNGGDCPTESNASVYFSRRNKTFCPVELI